MFFRRPSDIAQLGVGYETEQTGRSPCGAVFSFGFTGRRLGVSTSGRFNWEFYQFSQLGANGFFGRFNQDNSSVTGKVRLAARNGWLGHEIASRRVSLGDDLASGSDVAANYIYTTFIPSVKVNEVLSMQGVYRIGSWLTPSANASQGHLNTSRYLNSDAPGIGQSFSPGYWQIWQVVANVPWGTVTIGKQPNTIGLGCVLSTPWRTRVNR